MSARPRPVTATFPPPCLDSPLRPRRSSYVISPSSSTASLTSVLNHESYESIGGEDSRGGRSFSGMRTNRRGESADRLSIDSSSRNESSRKLATSEECLSPTDRQSPKRLGGMKPLEVCRRNTGARSARSDTQRQRFVEYIFDK